MTIVKSIRAMLRHTPGLLILVAAIALFAGMMAVAIARERESLRDRAAGTLDGRVPTPILARGIVPPDLPTTIPKIEAIDIPNAYMEYYDIDGSSADDLRAAMNQLGPLDPKGKRSDAYTNWYVRWNWPGYGRTDCDLTSVQVSYAITVTFPRWQPAGPVDTALIEKWHQYTRRLALHEKGHVDNVVKNQRFVQEAIEQATCSTAEAAANRALDGLRNFDLNYDRKTNHGATQGAVFP